MAIQYFPSKSIYATKPKVATLLTGSVAANVMTTALDITGSRGQLVNINLRNNQTLSGCNGLQITVDGVAFTIQPSYGSNVSPKDSTISTYLDTMNYFTTIYFYNSLKVEFYHTILSNQQIQGSVYYNLE